MRRINPNVANLDDVRDGLNHVNLITPTDWQAWTPVITGPDALPTFKSTTEAYYYRHQAMCFVSANLVMESGDWEAVGDQEWVISLPVTAADGVDVPGFASFHKADGTSHYPGTVRAVKNTATAEFLVPNANGTWVVVPLVKTKPITWEDGCAIRFSMTYPV